MEVIGIMKSELVELGLMDVRMKGADRSGNTRVGAVGGGPVGVTYDRNGVDEFKIH